LSENKSRVEKTFEVLRNEILLGQYRQGERLPSERDLSARFDVTRSVVRESIKKLEQLGIASVTPGGVRVLPIEDATLEILGPLLDLGEIQKIDLIVQFLDVFGGVLAMSSRLAVESASERELKDLASKLEAIIGSIGEIEEHREAWKTFTDGLLPIHKNLVLRLVGNGIRTQIMSDALQLDQDRDMEQDTGMLQTHLRKAVRALRGRDALGTSNALLEYVEAVKLSMSVRSKTNSTEIKLGHQGNA
jgi:DNA-binding FadR family transcriptional regulator